MKELLEAIIRFIRKYILDCIIPYSEPAVEVEPLLVADPPQKTSSTTSLLLQETASEADEEKAIDIAVHKDDVRQRAQSTSTVHRLPPGADKDLVIASGAGYYGSHNRKMLELVSRFNQSWDEEESPQYSPRH